MKHLDKTNASPPYHSLFDHREKMESKSKKMIIVVSLIFIATVIATLAITLPIVLRDGDEKANSTDSNFTGTTLWSTSSHPSSIKGTSTPIPGPSKLRVNSADDFDTIRSESKPWKS